MLKWLKKLFYGTKDGLPQKKISEEDLKKTENTQPAIYMISFICYRLLENAGVKFESSSHYAHLKPTEAALKFAADIVINLLIAI